LRPYLLDVNVLIALAWPSHVHHGEAQKWFARRRTAGFRTCPLTQIGFVRISCNPKFSPEAVSAREALVLLARITALPEHSFWPDDLALSQAIGSDELVVGHREIRDAYLLALAKAHGATLATLDRSVMSLPGADAGGAELIQESANGDGRRHLP